MHLLVFTIFAYRIVNINVESTKNVTKMRTMNRITKKIFEDEKFLKILLKLGKFRQKIPFCTKMRFTKTHILQYNSSYSEARFLKFGKSMQEKVQKIHRKRNFEFLSSLNFIEFFLIFVIEKQTKIPLKRKKIKN